MEITKIENCTGIYGLYLDEELVYIGKTIQGFQTRYRQHKHFVDFPNDSDTQYDMYYELAAAVALGRTLQLRPIFIVESARYNSLYNIIELLSSRCVYGLHGETHRHCKIPWRNHRNENSSRTRHLQGDAV